MNQEPTPSIHDIIAGFIAVSIRGAIARGDMTEAEGLMESVMMQEWVVDAMVLAMAAGALKEATTPGFAPSQEVMDEMVKRLASGG